MLQIGHLSWTIYLSIVWEIKKIPGSKILNCFYFGSLFLSKFLTKSAVDRFIMISENSITIGCSFFHIKHTVGHFLICVRSSSLSITCSWVQWMSSNLCLFGHLTASFLFLRRKTGVSLMPLTIVCSL